MSVDHERQRELGTFLRARREELVRAEYDLPPVGRRRAQGLRREEVAYHAGVSVTWYTWLEQGRDINPSRQVLDAIAQTLRLTRAEHDYVLSLSGYAPAPPVSMVPAAPAPPHIQHFLDAQVDTPAFAITPDWGIAAWNDAYEALYPNVATIAPQDRNLLWVIFTDPFVRDLLPDWENTSRRFLGEYRVQAGPYLGQPEHAALTTRLERASEAFVRAWSEHHIRPFATRERVFNHPVAGELQFEELRLVPSDVTDLHLVVYLPTEPTRHRLRNLRG